MIDSLCSCSDKSGILEGVGDWDQSDTCLTLVCPWLIPIATLDNILACVEEEDKRTRFYLYIHYS